jgi:hypothetical protein
MKTRILRLEEEFWRIRTDTGELKILHINPQAKVRVIWQESAQGFENAHPGVKVEFDYLENEAFKAKLPTLLQSKDRPSIFHSWGGGVMVEQIGRYFLPCRRPEFQLRWEILRLPKSTDAFSGLETVEALNSAQNDQRARTWILTFIHRLPAQTVPHAVARRKVELFWNSRGLRHKVN